MLCGDVLGCSGAACVRVHAAPLQWGCVPIAVGVHPHCSGDEEITGVVGLGSMVFAIDAEFANVR